MERQPWHSHVWELCDVYKYSVRGQWVDYSKSNDPFGDIWAFGGAYFNSCTGTAIIPSSPIKFPGQWIDIQYSSNIGYMARKADCSVWAWGCYNQNGDYGVGFSSAKINSPTQIPGRWKKYSLGIGIDLEDNLWTWGSPGNLGNCTNAVSLSMVQVPGKWLDFVRNYDDGYTTAAIKSDCSLWMWGNCRTWKITLTQPGTGYTLTPDVPIKIPGSWKTVSFTQAAHGVIGLKNNCTLWAWGRNDKGQHGDGTTVDKSSPIQIPGNWKCVTTTLCSTYAIRNGDGNKLWGWGMVFPPPSQTTACVSSPVIINGGDWSELYSDGNVLKLKQSDNTSWCLYGAPGCKLGYPFYYPCNNNIVFGCPAPICQFEEYKFSTAGGATLFINR